MTHDVNLLAIISDSTKNVVMKFLIAQQGKHKQLIECNLIGSGPGAGGFFTILPANPGGIVESFILFIVCE